MLKIRLLSSTIIKASLSTILFMTLVFNTNAQALYSKYFLDEASGITKMNAAFAPEYGYIRFPFLSYGAAMSSTAGMSDFLFLKPDGSKYTTFMNKSVDANLFLSKLSPNTLIDQSLHVDLFSFGFYTERNSFWTFNVGYRENLDVNLPYDFFKLAKKGMSSSNSVFDLSSIRFTQANIADVSLGYSRQIGSKVRVGLTAKMLIGLSSAQISYDKFDVTLSQDKYSVDASGNMVLVSDAITFPKDANNNYKFGDYDLNTAKLKPAGYGAAVDLGVTYNPIPRLKLSAGVNDLGSLKWNSGAVKHGVATGNVNFTGFNNVDALDANIDDEVDQLKEDAKSLIQFKEAAVTETYKYDLPTVVRAGAEFSIFNNPHHDILVGLLYQNYSSKLKSNDEVVGALSLRPLSWLMLTGTAAMKTKDYNRYGLALSFSPCWFNFYIASDFVRPNVNKQFIPIDKFNLNVETGLAFSFGESRKKNRKRTPAWMVPQPKPVPVQAVDSSTLVKKDTVPVAIPFKSDTLVVAPPAPDSLAVDSALKADTLVVKAVVDSVSNATPVVEPAAVTPPVVPELNPEPKVPVQLPIPPTTVKKTVKGKAVLNSKKKPAAKKPLKK